MTSKATTVAQYLQELPEDRRNAIEAVRKVILKNIDKGIEEGMQYGGIGYFIPHKIYPHGYHCDPKQPLPVIGLGAQKHHLSLGMMCLYYEPSFVEEFQNEYRKSGKKLDMGKCCIRFKKLEDLPLDLIGKTIKKIKTKEFIRFYETHLPESVKAKRAKLAK